MTMDLRSLTYEPVIEKLNTLDQNLPPVRKRKRAFGKPLSDLGLLASMPPELIQATLTQLDLQSLANLRMVNRQASSTVDSVPMLRAIVKHAPHALRGALKIETAQYINCETLHRTLHTTECKTCGDFGTYIYLLTCERVCFSCLVYNRNYLPCDFTTPKKFEALRESLLDLPHMISLPGIYSPRKERCRKRLLWDRRSILRDASDSIKAQLEKIEGPYYTGVYADKTRCMAVVEILSLDAKTGLVIEGFHCLACRDSRSYGWNGQRFNPRRAFWSHSFEAHLVENGPIVEGRHEATNARQYQARYRMTLAWNPFWDQST
ncbi:hypothetical protein AUEXF2481DRAFT_93005 [Aureobasidium subglaciale EXF-2481]|uniref:F-box domain-containing protein n=1 Tax=Aureobasidium subglaciale (strain EXF-2481) TaxID=1043005 RepID=A0A074XY39_AURSE|nr:uncharacterized protein AUEXF2481DRAFT_93005 [Aureobasidium subglaciale EXF-2481]KEQ90390.1 hypothetical protein AUEXF2481DRAFT_93005 [Aureobasidium subglaciale EXF-2481]